MIKVLALVLLFSTSLYAYVPTVESLFRFGSNPDVTGNALSITMMVKRMDAAEQTTTTTDSSLLAADKAEDYYKLFFTHASEDNLKVAQTRYADKMFNEASLEHKIYYPHFTAYTIKPNIEQVEKGLFFGMLHSLTLNNGSHMVNYLKSLGVPVRLNNDLINRQKLELMAEYKRYLVTIGKDRNARKTEVNPLRPVDAAARDIAEQIMTESMYVDTKQVKLTRDQGMMAWLVTAGPFEAVFSHRSRQLQRMRYRTNAGEFEILCKDYYLANGTHALPRFIIVRNFAGVTYQVEIKNLRHYIEREDDIARRLKGWDQVLKGKESTDPRPEFLL